MPGLAGSGRDRKKSRFVIKFLLKSSDFDCPGWPGAAGMEKSKDFQLNSFQKVAILIAWAGQERPGWKKYRSLVEFLSKRNNFDCRGWRGAVGMEKSMICN